MPTTPFNLHDFQTPKTTNLVETRFPKDSDYCHCVFHYANGSEWESSLNETLHDGRIYSKNHSVEIMSGIRTSKNFEKSKRNLTVLLLRFSLVVGIPLNLLVMYVTLCHLQKRNLCSWLVLNLALADLLS